MLSKDRCKTTSGFNYCERRNELSSWRPVALTNRHIHLCLFKLGYDVLHCYLVLCTSSLARTLLLCTQCHDEGEIRTPQVANRLDRARAIYIRLLHLTPMIGTFGGIRDDIFEQRGQCSAALYFWCALVNRLDACKLKKCSVSKHMQIRFKGMYLKFNSLCRGLPNERVMIQFEEFSLQGTPPE